MYRSICHWRRTVPLFLKLHQIDHVTAANMRNANLHSPANDCITCSYCCEVCQAPEPSDSLHPWVGNMFSAVNGLGHMTIMFSTQSNLQRTTSLARTTTHFVLPEKCPHTVHPDLTNGAPDLRSWVSKQFRIWCRKTKQMHTASENRGPRS
jgi:hypothetical protein